MLGLAKSTSRGRGFSPRRGSVERARLAKRRLRGTSERMSDALKPTESRKRPAPTTPAPSPQHYWDRVQGSWRLRQGNRPHDPAAFALQVEAMKIEASARPPRSRPCPADSIHRKTMTQILEELPRVIDGEVIPATPPPRKYPLAPVDFGQSVDRLRLVGLDELLALTIEGHSQREVCLRIGTRPSHVQRWIASIEGAEPRMREARKLAAQAWVDRGLAAIADAVTPMDLAKGREMALMCRKYAALCDPSYSDRVQVDTTIRAEDPGSIDAKLRLLVQQVAQKAVKDEDKPQ